MLWEEEEHRGREREELHRGGYQFFSIKIEIEILYIYIYINCTAMLITLSSIHMLGWSSTFVACVYVYWSDCK